jgi:hypothetical protein
VHTFEVAEVPQTALWEYLSAAKLSLDFHKPADWGDQAGNPLGFAAALLLFSIIDAIGSYHKGTGKAFPIDGIHCKITTTDQHFFVLNSPDYYGLTLSPREIRMLYENYRSALSHNAGMAAQAKIYIDHDDSRCFTYRDGEFAANLSALFKLSIVVVEKFLRRDLVSTSLVTANLRRRR